MFCDVVPKKVWPPLGMENASGKSIAGYKTLAIRSVFLNQRASIIMFSSKHSLSPIQVMIRSASLALITITLSHNVKRGICTPRLIRLYDHLLG